MVGRVIEIATDGRHLSINRGFLVVSEKSEEVGRIPLDDIAAVLANAHGLTYTNNALVELSGRGVPIVLCGPNHMPAAIVWPVDAHHLQTGRMHDQISAGLPLKKRLWAQLVRTKILVQAATLAATGASNTGFYLLSRKVRSGDPDNVEAEAARRYWPLLLGQEFRRDKDGDAINGLLNYGYAVLRAGIARAVMAAGLHPGFGLMHSSRSNPMVLIDDLMEPFRPVVDREVWRLVQNGTKEVDRDAKAALAKIMVIDLPTGMGLSPLMTCAERLAQSLARAYAGDGDSLDLPLPALPLES
ncbi:MAG TPA: type II CRISPR-associated endonuclease Cas1 [Rhizomicrobium sp.]|jgi:CRISPR-associated protein Cas1|nr:type II CRISPR-associated endonuclease Cas1 [Rhizomicrobium sp.]